MLIRVPVEQVRVGMYVASLESSWINNPFWRSHFSIATRDDLATLLASGIEYVVIDDGKGLGVGAESELAADERLTEEPVVTAVQRPAIERRARPRPLNEIQRAQAVVDRSKAEVTRMFGEARLGNAVQMECVAPLVEEIAASVSRDPSAMVKVTRLKTKNEYTYLHSVAVCALMMNLARHLGLPDRDIRDIGTAGLLHDIGKMAMPTAVLDKPGALDDGEFKLIRSHPEKGHAMLVGSPDISAMALDVCLHHHERVDGRGYPHGLTANELSIHARMGAICDVYDAVTSNRPYKRAWSPSEALARMLEWEGHFDRHLLDAFIASIGIHPIGALVRLRTQRLGLIIAGNDDDPVAPTVRAFYDIPEGCFIAPEDVATIGTATTDRVLKGEQGEYWFGGSWPELQANVREGIIDRSFGIPVQTYVARAAR